MCLEFYRRAALDYDASFIEFHFLPSGGWQFCGCECYVNTVESQVKTALKMTLYICEQKEEHRGNSTAAILR